MRKTILANALAKMNEPPDFYAKVINPPWEDMTPQDMQKWLYDIWARGGGYNSYIPNLVGLLASVTELNYSVGLTGPIQAQLDSKARIVDLGTMAAQNADDVVITGGSISSTPIEGSTGSFTDAQAESLSIEIGDSTSYAAVPACLLVQSTPVGNIGAGEDQLMTYTLPANSLSTNSIGLKLTAFGRFAANVNNKDLKLYFGTATILDTGAIVANGTSWQINALILNKSTSSQTASATIISDDPLIGAYSSAASPSEAITGAIIIKLTGQGTADNDIVQDGLIIEWMKSE